MRRRMTSISFVIAASILGVLPASAVAGGRGPRRIGQPAPESLSGKLKGIATTGATKILNTGR